MTPPLLLLSLPDGWRVALCHTGSGSPPGRYGMSTASTELWCRLVRGDFDTGWWACNRRSLLHSRQWWDLVESAADIPNAWIGCVGGVWPPPRYDDTFFAGRDWLDSL